MSNAILNAAWSCRLSGSDKLVLVALADFARPDGRTWLPLDGPTGLIRRCGLARRTVQRAIARLVQAGHVTRTERPGRGVVYTVHPVTGDRVAPVAASATWCATVAPNPSRTQIEDRTKPRGVWEIETPPPGVSDSQWSGFLELRLASGRPLTSRGADLLRKRLIDLSRQGFEPGSLLDDAILNGWTNVFPPRSKARGRSGSRDTAQPNNASPLIPPVALNPRQPMPVDRCTPEQAAKIMREIGLRRG